ncbi:MAG TPA: glycosyltransferase family 87 protein [Tepidisphaeraceae bacterium]|nr:glycosyltransferase family 87 protein [Tepidisphaeraceae bacterium]
MNVDGSSNSHQFRDQLSQEQVPGTQVNRSASPLLSILRHPYSIALALALIIMGFGATFKHQSAWDRTGPGVSMMLREGLDFYAIEKTFTYPPFQAWLNIPLTWMPLRPARAIWFILSAACLVYMIWESWRLAGGPRLEPLGEHGDAKPREHWAFVLGLVCALQFALNSLTHLQTDLLIGALLTAGCAAIVTRRVMRAATWIGLAAAFKCTPLLFAPYLVWKRKPVAAAWLVIIAIGANVLPNTVHAPPQRGLWLAEWSRLYLAPMERANYVPGDWKNQLDNNQSFAGAAKRWLMTTWRIAPGEFHVVDRIEHPSPVVIRSAYLLSCLAALLIAAWAMLRRAPSKAFDEASNVGTPPPQWPSRDIIECGIVLLLMVLLSPNSSRAHFCVMMLPAFCIGRLAFGEKSRWLTALLIAAAVCSTLSIHIRLDATLAAEQILLWIGVVMFAAIFLLWASIIALMHPPSKEIG